MFHQRDAESRINLHSFNLKYLSANPTDVQDGDVWAVDTGMVKEIRCKLGTSIIVIATND